MTTKHTPAPWKLEVHNFAGGSITSEKGLSIAVTGNAFGDIKQDEANARLIAAAPELLEALEYAYEMLAAEERNNYNPYLLEVVEKASAAIAKATA